LSPLFERLPRAGEREHPQADALIEGRPAEVGLADAASDRDRRRQAIAPKGAVAVIPTIHPALARTRATTTVTLSAALIECCFSKLKQFRRAAARFEKTARN